MGIKFFWILFFSWLSQWKIQRVILSLCYRPELFKSWLQTRDYPFEVRCLVELSPLGTGGAIRYAIEQEKISEPFGVLNGDTYLNFDFGEMVRQFKVMKCHAMIGLSHVPNTERYGSVVFENQQAISFNEKASSAGEGWINNGFYILTPYLFKTYKRSFSIEKDMFPSLCKNQQLNVFTSEGEFVDIGIPEDYYHFVNYLITKIKV